MDTLLTLEPALPSFTEIFKTLFVRQINTLTGIEMAEPISNSIQKFGELGSKIPEAMKVVQKLVRGYREKMNADGVYTLIAEKFPQLV